MLPFHCFGEELKGGGRWHFLLAQWDDRAGCCRSKGASLLLPPTCRVTLSKSFP